MILRSTQNQNASILIASYLKMVSGTQQFRILLSSRLAMVGGNALLVDVSI